MVNGNGKPRRDWIALAVAIAVPAIIIAGSIGLVRYKNRNRGATQAIAWAVESLLGAPESTVTNVFPVHDYAAAGSEFLDHLRDKAIPVDSLRAFYQEYALWARDGVFSTDEVAAFGAYLGIQRLPEHPPVDSLNPETTDSGR